MHHGDASIWLRFRRGLSGPIALALLLAGSAQASAETKSLTVLDFELIDLTLLPDTPEEIERTASVAPMLRKELTERNELRVVDVGSLAQTQADRGVGYLFQHDGVAADLASRHGAEYIAVGRVHKPSFLFVYLMVHLVDVADKARIGDFVVEVKGQTPRALQGGVERLAEKISGTLVAAN
jgi:hypothetical protein